MKIIAVRAFACQGKGNTMPRRGDGRFSAMGRLAASRAPLRSFQWHAGTGST